MRYVFAFLLACLLLQGCSSSQPTSVPDDLRIASEQLQQTDIVPSATALAPSVALPTPTEEWYEYAGCENLSHPRYPKLLLYPDYRDLIHTSAPTDLAEIRSTTFRSSAAASTILAWYREQALADAWQEEQFTATTSEYVYTANAICGPAFSMIIAVTSDDSGSIVTMTREFSGPFSTEFWPKD
ncbi:hypothetical protein [Herpetosiphon llansteffanensis]|uniref:hypothetical protein n=1 Tax=Herpetosiphon llansteffanensis TaxID=2094568 RepID=UPI000D7BF501|nr:hypothetical protein [Herpetosiphon llansteffanensis]